MSPDRILIIDGLNFIYRGVLNFKSSDYKEDKEDYTIVYSFFRNLRALIELMKPQKIFFALEGNPQFRKDIFPAYKANRLNKQASTDSRTRVLKQANIIIELLSYLPISTVRAAEYEADDVINTLAQDLSEEDVVIVSTDSDLIQILQSSKGNISLYHPGKKDYIRPPVFSYLVWKCLAGDKKSDNIPGLVSESKATELASNLKMLADFLSIEENRANFSLNRQLIELRHILAENIIIDQGSIDLDLLFSKFEEFEFNSLLETKYKERFAETFACCS